MTHRHMTYGQRSGNDWTHTDKAVKNTARDSRVGRSRACNLTQT